MIKKVKILAIIFISLLSFTKTVAQVDTLFWFAAPWVTPDHSFRDPVRLYVAGDPGTTVRIWQPAAIAPNQYDTTVTLPASGFFAYTFWRDKLATTTNIGYDSLECRPTNSVVPYGLKISANNTITAVYDVVSRGTAQMTFGSNPLNPETFSLKGQNGLGTEFVCPFQTTRFNQPLGNLANTPPGVMQPKQQINIVATVANTTVWITPRCPVIGHPANITYSVFLPNPGDAFTVENAVQTTNVAGNNLSGSIVTSSQPIAVTVADDSVRGVTGCYDLMGDQIVPVDIVGREYILIGGRMNVGEFEGAYIVATENFTQININNGTPQAPVMLNQGDTYYFAVPQNTVCYVLANKNIYVLHMTGFGCELGEALLPPMDCGGSNNIKFSRNNTQTYFLNVLCLSSIVNNFTLNANPALLTGGDFTIVPGTGGLYSAAQRSYTPLEIAVSTNTNSNLLSNNTTTNTVFSLGVYNGGGSTGCMYHYMSLFFRKTLINTPTINPICFGATPTIALTGSITGGVTNGYWTVVAGNGTLSPSYGSSVIYTLAPGDATIDTLRFRLISDKNCKGDSVMAITKIKVHRLPIPQITSTVAPMCKNNITPISLTGTVSYGVGSWTGGVDGVFGIPGANTTYTPGPGDLAAGTITLNLVGSSTVGCTSAMVSMTVGFIDPPFVNPGANTLVCTNSSSLQLNGSITGYTTGIWNSTGTGLFFPNNSTPTATYALSVGDLSLTSIVFSLTSIPHPSTGCAAETKTMVVSIIPKPNVNAGTDFSVCASSTLITLNGNISGAATTGSWTTVNGSGAFPPPNAVPQATYLVGPSDPAAGTLTMVLHSDAGTCPTNMDTLLIHIVSDPIITVPSNTTVCENANIILSGTIVAAISSGYWTASPGGGVFTPTNSLFNCQYTPSPSDISAGTIIMTLHSDDVFCGNTSKSFTVTVISSPDANFAYPTLGRCVDAGITFTNTSLANGSSTLNPTWNFGDGTGVSIANTPIHTFTNSGSYLITLTVTGNNNCFDTITKRVSIAPLPISDFTVNNACAGTEAVFQDLSQSLPGGGFINSWTWQFGDTPPTPSVTGIPTTTVPHIYLNPGLYFAALTVSTNIGCLHTSNQTLNIAPQPQAEFAMTNNPAVAQEPIYFSDFSTPSANINSWFWQFGDETTGTGNAPSHSYPNAGTFTILLTVTDNNGCTDTVSHAIEITLLPQVPTAFTPNGDNNNDLLFVKGGPFNKILFRVYNNWGELLFETTDQNVGWDGKKNGKEQPLGVYVWTLDVEMYNNRQVKKNGDVTLMR
ncbi:MAG: PKD domain-containing protein [Sphingobacteriaceae bacterium]|nr:PKD domain-containing protein [Sphingobacteriaceae bacterium]